MAQPEIYGDGDQSRDFTHISNVLDGNILAMTTQDVTEINGQVLNLLRRHNNGE